LFIFEFAVPGSPPDLTNITSRDPYSVSFRVSPPVRPNGLVTAYTFYVSFGNASCIVAVDQSGLGGLTVGGIFPYQLVAVRVSANNSAGEGPRSSMDEIRTQQSGTQKKTQTIVIILIEMLPHLH